MPVSLAVVLRVFEAGGARRDMILFRNALAARGEISKAHPRRAEATSDQRRSKDQNVMTIPRREKFSTVEIARALR
jgi:hypothetical protein